MVQQLKPTLDYTTGSHSGISDEASNTPFSNSTTEQDASDLNLFKNDTSNSASAMKHQSRNAGGARATSHQLGGDFWTGLADKFGGLRELLEISVLSDEEDDRQTLSSRLTQSDGASALFPLGDAHHTTGPHCYPPKIQRDALMELFLKNVHPLLPIMQPRVIRAHFQAWDNLIDPATGRVKSASMEAAMVTILLAALVSLSPAECVQMIGQEREFLLLSYKAMSEDALSSAEFTNSIELATLQAFVLYLVSHHPILFQKGVLLSHF